MDVTATNQDGKGLTVAGTNSYPSRNTDVVPLKRVLHPVCSLEKLILIAVLFDTGFETNWLIIQHIQGELSLIINSMCITDYLNSILVSTHALAKRFCRVQGHVYMY